MPGSVDYATLDVEGVGEDLFRELEIFERRLEWVGGAALAGGGVPRPRRAARAARLPGGLPLPRLGPVGGKH